MPLEILPELDSRIPSWPLDQIGERGCPLCGVVNSPLFARPDRLPVAFCSQCGLWYVSGLPAESAIEEMYRGYWHKVRPRRLDARVLRAMLIDARRTAGLDPRIQRLAALSGGLAGKKVLEMGCGVGSFLLALRESGADAVGQDISPEACQFVRKVLKLPVFEGPIPTGLLKDFDIIVMNDLVEHLVHPLDQLREALDILRPEGLLLIWTPNSGAAGETVGTALGWVGFRIDLEHLQYFSPRSVEMLTRYLSLNIEHLETRGHPALDDLGGRAGAASSLKNALRGLLVRIPYSLRTVRAIRSFVGEMRSAGHGDRDGTYHLFTILRKRTGALPGGESS